MEDCGTGLETLADFREGRLDEGALARLTEHLGTGCTRCQGTLAWLDNFLPALSGGELAGPSAAALRRAARVFRDDQRQRRRAAAPASALESIARLVFGGGPAQALAAGVRDVGTGGEPLQALYSTDTHDVDLWAEAEEGGRGTFYLIGQVRHKVTGEAVTPMAVAMERHDGGDPVFATPDSAEFHVADVPSGTYSVRIVLSDWSGLVLPDVSVGGA